jgi:TonB family protein
MITYTATEYRQLIFTPADELFRRCLFGSAVLGLLVIGVVIFTPIREHSITHVTQLPKRFARLILEKPVPVAPAETIQPAEQIEAAEEVAPEAEPEPMEKPRPRTRQPETDPNIGRIGRERAEQEISSELASTTAALQSSLEDLSASLQSSKSEATRPTRKRRSRRVRSGRSESQVSAVQTGLAGGGGTANLGGSTVKGSRVAIGTLSSTALSSSGVTSDAAEKTSQGTGAAPGVYRSNSSILAVIQKYSAGIHYCYSNELKRNESLSGKLVVTMTVAASGEVVEATVIENSLGSQRLGNCALAQIRDWKFPAIQGGLTTFQAPFVFTPPK